MTQNYKGRKAMQEARSLLLFEIIWSGLYCPEPYRYGYISVRLYQSTKYAV